MKNNKVVLTYYYTGIDDVWHHKVHKKSNVHDFDVLYDSVENRGYDFVTLANEWNRLVLKKGAKDWRVIGLEGDLAKPDDMSLYVHKFIACYEWLKNHPEYEEIWIVDSSDTEMLTTPDPKPGIIYTGYEIMSELTYNREGSRVYGNGASYNCTNNVTATELCNKLNNLTETITLYQNTTAQLEKISKQCIQIQMSVKILETEVNKLSEMVKNDNCNKD